MIKIRTSIKKHKNIFIFLGIIFLFAVISGMLFYFQQDNGVKKTILLNLGDIFSHNVFDIKNLFFHIISILIIIASSFVFLSIPLILILIFFEGISLGFIIPIFFSIYKLNFIFPFLIFFFLIKFIYLILLFFVFIHSCKFTKDYFIYIKSKKISFLIELKKIFALIGLITINDLCIYFLFNKLIIFLLN